jgi:single-strand DNA-binding protein
MNKVLLAGHLGKDPEVRHLDGGNVVANFSLATSESFKNKRGEKVTNTEWHNIVFWNKQAEICEKYLKKGSHILVEGKMRTRSYDDKEGKKRFVTEVYCTSLEMLGTKSESSTSGPSRDDRANQQAEVIDQMPDYSKDSFPPDDLPF